MSTPRLANEPRAKKGAICYANRWQHGLVSFGDGARLAENLAIPDQRFLAVHLDILEIVERIAVHRGADKLPVQLHDGHVHLLGLASVYDGHGVNVVGDFDGGIDVEGEDVALRRGSRCRNEHSPYNRKILHPTYLEVRNGSHS